MIPDIEIDSGWVHVRGMAPPLQQLASQEVSGQRHEYGCEACAYTGHDLWAYARGQSAVCPECRAQPAILTPYVDADGDAWLDGIPRALARWSGGERKLEAVTTLVVHRYSRGRGAAGPRYVRDPGGRHVSWHATVHYAGYDVPSTLHLPADRVGWHAGHKRINACSIGVELDAATSGDVHAPYDGGTIEELGRLVESWRAICPQLQYCVGHADIVPRRRSDPGRRFPWQALDALGLERLDHETLALAWS